MPEDEKVRENRLRRMASRQGLHLVKSRRRDPRALDYGCFHIADVFTNTIVAGELNSPRALTLDEVEEYLMEERPRRPGRAEAKWVGTPDA